MGYEAQKSTFHPLGKIMRHGEIELIGEAQIIPANCPHATFRSFVPGMAQSDQGACFAEKWRELDTADAQFQK
jgi:hypothetical protein